MSKKLTEKTQLTQNEILKLVPDYPKKGTRKFKKISINSKNLKNKTRPVTNPVEREERINQLINHSLMDRKSNLARSDDNRVFHEFTRKRTEKFTRRKGDRKTLLGF